MVVSYHSHSIPVTVQRGMQQQQHQPQHYSRTYGPKQNAPGDLTSTLFNSNSHTAQTRTQGSRAGATVGLYVQATLSLKPTHNGYHPGGTGTNTYVNSSKQTHNSTAPMALPPNHTNTLALTLMHQSRKHQGTLCPSYFSQITTLHSRVYCAT